MSPVDFDEFLNDPKVQDLINSTKVGRLITEAEFGIEDMCPQLLLNSGSYILEGGTFTLHKNTAQSAVITVANASIYTHIEWYCITTTPLITGVSDNGAQFTARTSNAPFNNAGRYMVTVAGLTPDDKVYGTSFNIEVEP
jgi:hypothetical protein